MSMIVTLYLISAIVYNAVDAPHGRGFSKIEVWMLGAQCPILIALFEYGFVLYLKRHVKKAQNQVQTMTRDPNQVQEINLDHTMTSDQNQVQSMTPDDQGAELDDKIRQLDSATMIFSFLFFTTFALVYWMVNLRKKI